jgi:hypothetical protein
MGTKVQFNTTAAGKSAAVFHCGKETYFTFFTSELEETVINRSLGRGVKC